MRRARDGGEHHQVARPDQILGRVTDGDPAYRAAAFQVRAESLGVPGVEVMELHPLELPSRALEIGVDISARWSPVPKKPTVRGRPRSRVSQSAASAAEGRCTRGADDGALHTGDRITGVPVVEHQHGGGAGNPGVNVLREAGYPLHAVDARLSADRGGQCDDARGRPVRKPQEVRRRIDRVTLAVDPVRLFDQRDDLLLMPAQHLVDLCAGDDGEGGICAFMTMDGSIQGEGRPDGRSVRDGGLMGGRSVGETHGGAQTTMPTSRCPSYGSRLCAMRMLSTRRTSPACHGSRRVAAS